MKFKMMVEQEVEIDLNATPYVDWPEDAKQLARKFIAKVPKNELFKREWIVAKVEQMLEVQQLEEN